ncbi:MAG TPA: potassium channel family protein [Candidatus Limnocylindrales bacterium]|nr:potassium channel family protein [Candidatus Limnocylindrales bacterium]
MILNVLVGIAGAALVVSSLADLFISVVVPRSVGGRLRPSALISRNGWRFWRDQAMRIEDAERREDTLAVFAPTLLVTLLAYWVLSEIVGYGLLFWALRAGLRPEPHIGGAIYFAGTSLLTIGYGDIVPLHWYTRALSLFAAGGGLATFAIVTTFLFQTFAAFQRREAFVVTISERTGAPPSGLEFVVRHLKLGMPDDIGTILRESQRWIAEVMETHLAYPVLTYFRSSHDDESWVGTLGALLDASTLLITTLDLDHRGQAEITLRLGSHLVRDFTGFFHLPQSDAAGVEYDEFVTAYRTLRELGVPLRPLEDAWPAFSRKRASYAVPLEAMARWWRIPPARWIGDRSRVRLHVNVGVPR